jgi:hypothetical protein
VIRAALAALAVGLLLGFGAGWKVQAWRWAAADAQALEDARELRAQRERAADHAAEQHEQAKAQLDAQIQVITREVEHVVERPVYRNVCVDADGLRQLAQAIGAADPAGQPAPAVRAPDDAR